MAYSFVKYVADGTTSTFSVPFSYLSKSYVYVEVDNEAQEFSFVSEGVIRLQNTPPDGAVVHIYRLTPIEQPAVVFSNNSRLTAQTLNNLSEQLLHAVQEAYDKQINIDFYENVLTALEDEINETFQARDEVLSAQANIEEIKNIVLSAKNEAVQARDEALQAQSLAESAKQEAISAKDQAYTYLKQMDDWVHKGEWSINNVPYAVNNMVTFEGSTYVLYSGDGSVAPPDPNYWKLVAKKGDSIAYTEVNGGEPATIFIDHLDAGDPFNS